MNLTDKDIDKLYQEKAAASSFKYDDAYWKEMEAMLPKSNGKDFLWMVTSILFLGLVTFSFIRTNGTTFENNTVLVAEETSLISTESNQNNTTQERNSGSIIESPLNNQSNISPIQESETINNQQQSTQNKNSENENNISALENTPHHPMMEQNHQSSIKKENQYVNDHNLGKNNSSTLIVALDVSVEKVNTLKDIKVKKENIAAPSKEITSNLTLKNLSLFPNKELGIAPFSNTKMPLRNQFYIQAVGGVSQAMITPSNQLSYSFGAGIGMQMNKGRFVINTGINGTWSRFDDLILTRQAKVYGFGSEIVNYQIKYKEIFSLEADLSIGYQFSNHIIRVGLRPSYIIGTKVGYKELQNDDEKGEHFYGYKKGLSLFGIKPMIGYTYLLNQNLSIGINIGMQLLPLIDQKYINGQNRSLPIDGQIYIRRTLHLRK